jgi:hypothetical protein
LHHPRSERETARLLNGASERLAALGLYPRDEAQRHQPQELSRRHAAARLEERPELPCAARPRPQRLKRGRAVGSQHRVAVEAAVGFSAWVAATALIGDLRGEAFPLRSPRF